MRAYGADTKALTTSTVVGGGDRQLLCAIRRRRQPTRPSPRGAEGHMRFPGTRGPTRTCSGDESTRRRAVRRAPRPLVAISARATGRRRDELGERAGSARARGAGGGASARGRVGGDRRAGARGVEAEDVAETRSRSAPRVANSSCAHCAARPRSARGRRRRARHRSLARLARVDDGVDEGDGGADAGEGGVVRGGRDVRRGDVEIHRGARLAQEVQPADEVLGVHAHHLLGGRGAEPGELDELARSRRGGQVGVHEGVEDRGDARVALGVAVARVVQRRARGEDELRREQIGGQRRRRRRRRRGVARGRGRGDAADAARRAPGARRGRGGENPGARGHRETNARAKPEGSGRRDETHPPRRCHGAFCDARVMPWMNSKRKQRKLPVS